MRVPDAGIGTCRCGARFEHRLVEVNLYSHDELVHIDDASQAACPNCGTMVYRGSQLELLEAEIRGLTAGTPSSRY